MKLGRVLGRVVSTQKLQCFDGKTLLLLQPVDEKLKPTGRPIVAIDTVQAGEGETVFYEGGKEAAQSLKNWFNPCDAAIIGIVDAIQTEGER